MPRENEPTRLDDANDDDIIGWFRTLASPRDGQVSPHLRASVLAQIDQRRARRKLWRWVSPAWPTAWVAVGTAALVLSLSVNVWWGVQILRQRVLASQPSPQSLSTYRFQQDLQHPQAFGAAVPARLALQEQTGGLGFAPQDTRIPCFRMGTVYTDALATLRSGALETAMQHVDLLIRMLEGMQAPAALSDYLHQMQTLVHSRQYGAEPLTTFLALFESLYEAAYRQPEETEAWTFFHIGTWLENMSLAARAGETTVLRQDVAVQHFRTALTSLGVPHDVLQALGQVSQLVAAHERTDRSRMQIHQLVQEMQRTLGAMPE
jgi:hypothetical protein